MPEAARSLFAAYCLFFRTVSRPACCVHCGGDHVVWDGSAIRTASVVADGKVVHLTGIPIRRAQCQACDRSWRVRPPGLMPHRHYQLCVVAVGAAVAMFAGLTLEAVAKRCCCSRWTVARWLRWLDAIATPAHLLARLVEVVGPVLPPLYAVAAVMRHGATAAARVGAAAVVSLLEAIGQALCMEPPGLRSVVEGVLDNRSRHSTYARPSIPEFAQSRFGGRLSMMPM